MRILLLLTAVILIAVVELANGNEFEIHFKNENACNAGAPVGNKKVQGKSIVYNSKFRVLDAYIYWTNGNGKIIGMAVCNVPASTGCTADKVPSKGAAKVYLVLSVTLQKSSFEDQNIHYQYFDEYFELSKVIDPLILRLFPYHLA
uniref:DUF3747 domain-containing protein n=1 Tax=Caenorhabditis tropicalis TaxID=1561998 RepID=A0A1I7TE81_9PELO